MKKKESNIAKQGVRNTNDLISEKKNSFLNIIKSNNLKALHEKELENFTKMLEDAYRSNSHISPDGQYAHPGENTLIPSNDITMRGVPYPVLGVDNLGNEQMMYPEGDYNFPGADYVTEFPMMQFGGQKPTLYVDPNDPKGRAMYQAYQDSLKTYSTNDFLFKDVKQQLGKDFDKFDVIDLTVPQLKSIFSYDPNIIKEYFGRGNDPVKGINVKVKPQYYNQRYNNTQFLEYIFPVFAKPTQPVEYKPNPEIVAKQQQLIDAGYKIGKADGIWGPKSQAAWEEFQNKQVSASPQKVQNETTSENTERIFENKNLQSDEKFTDVFYNDVIVDYREDPQTGKIVPVYQNVGSRKLVNKQFGGQRATAADSLAVANSAKEVANYYNNKNYYLDYSWNKLQEKGSPSSYLYERTLKPDFLKDKKDLYNSALESAKKFPVPETSKDYYNYKYITGPKKGEFIPYEDYFKQLNKHQFQQREEKRKILDTRSPMPLYDTRIYPSGQVFLINKDKKDPYFGDQVTFPVYDPLAVTPWNMLSEDDKKLRLELYGSEGTPIKGHAPNISKVENRLKELYKSNPQQKKEPNLNTDLAAWLKTQGASASFADRKKLYEQVTGQTDYKGTAEQNIGLLKMLKQDKPKTQGEIKSVEIEETPNTILDKTYNLKNKNKNLQSDKKSTDVFYDDVIVDYREDPQTGKIVPVYQNVGSRKLVNKQFGGENNPTNNSEYFREYLAKIKMNQNQSPGHTAVPEVDWKLSGTPQMEEDGVILYPHNTSYDYSAANKGVGYATKEEILRHEGSQSGERLMQVNPFETDMLGRPAASSRRLSIPQGFQKGGQKGGKVLNIKDNADWFDSRAVYHQNSDFNEIIKKKIYAGTHGYNPETGELVLLKNPVDIDPQKQLQASPIYGDKLKRPNYDLDKKVAQNEAKKYVDQNMKEITKHPLWNAPGLIYGSAIAPAAGIMGTLPQTFESASNIYEGEGSAGDYLDIAMSALPLAGGLKKVAKDAYKLNPRALKETPYVPMYRTQKPGQTQEVLELLDLQKKADEIGISNLSMAEKTKLSQFQTRPNIGQGFDTDLSKANYYGNPNIRKTRGYDETPEVLRTVVPREQAELFNVKNFPEYAKQSTATRTEHILPMDMVQQAEKFSFDDLARLRKEESLLNPKPHWLKGYPKPTSSVDDVGRGFKSEIDWAKWNKEIPENKALMQEYNAIEQQAKANGTWMKNPDGSTFQGTPEQFVQQNSSNFKKAFPNPVRDKDGNIQTNYHGTKSDVPFSVFKKSKPHRHWYGIGTYTTPYKERALGYTTGMNNEEQLMELYINSNNPQKRIENIFDKKYTMEDISLQPPHDYIYTGGEQVTPYNNFLKAMRGNNGMFDMTNPNIYKSVLPIGLGLGAASQMEQKKYGGNMNNKLKKYQFAGNVGNSFITSREESIGESNSLDNWKNVFGNRFKSKQELEDAYFNEDPEVVDWFDNQMGLNREGLEQEYYTSPVTNINQGTQNLESSTDNPNLRDWSYLTKGHSYTQDEMSEHLNPVTNVVNDFSQTVSQNTTNKTTPSGIYVMPGQKYDLRNYPNMGFPFSYNSLNKLKTPTQAAAYMKGLGMDNVNIETRRALLPKNRIKSISWGTQGSQPVTTPEAFTQEQQPFGTMTRRERSQELQSMGMPKSQAFFRSLLGKAQYGNMGQFENINNLDGQLDFNRSFSGLGPDEAEAILAGMAGVTSIFDTASTNKLERDYKDAYMRDASQIFTPDTRTNRGDYGTVGQASGMLRPDKYVPTFRQVRTAQQGGELTEGQIAELSDEEIRELIAQGYDIEILD